MTGSMPPSGSRPIENDPFAFLDMTWSSAPAAEAETSTSSGLEPSDVGSSLNSRPPLPEISNATVPMLSSVASASSPTLTDMEIERQAKALVQFDQQLSQLAAKARTLSSLLDLSTSRMTTDLQVHAQALRAQIALSQGQTTAELQKARQRLRRALRLAVLTPILTTLAVCLLAIAATWAFAQLQVAEAQAAQARLEQSLRPAPQSPAANGRRRP